MNKRGPGHPSKYPTHVLPRLRTIRAWRRHGWALDAIAKKLGISMSTLMDYQRRFPQFADVLSQAKEDCDAEIEDALYRRAKGYDITETTMIVERRSDGTVPGPDDPDYYSKARQETKTRHVEPNLTAIIFYLLNRLPELWRDRRKEVSADAEAIAGAIRDSGRQPVNIINYVESLPKDEQSKLDANLAAALSGASQTNRFSRN